MKKLKQTLNTYRSFTEIVYVYILKKLTNYGKLQSIPLNKFLIKLFKFQKKKYK